MSGRPRNDFAAMAEALQRIGSAAVEVVRIVDDAYRAAFGLPSRATVAEWHRYDRALARIDRNQRRHRKR